MGKVDESRRYKWTASATNLLLTIWSHDMVQNQLKVSFRNLPVWKSIARYMARKGFAVSGLQCRTRIKNMLAIYYEAVRKNDHSCIEPYFDLFNRVVHNSNSPKKKASRKRQTSVHETEDDGVDEDVRASSDPSIDVDESQNPNTSEYNVEYLDVNQYDTSSQSTTIQIDNKSLQQLENIITKAINDQTTILSEAVKFQSETFEKLLLSEREKFESIILAERESRKQLEFKLDKVLNRLEAAVFPNLSFMGALLEHRQSEVL